MFDLKEMVITNLVTDKALLNRIFREAGRKEFRFIARSGIYFGGTIGLLQMTLWVLFHEPLIMPAFGLIVGWFTDWLALKMIFNPKRADPRARASSGRGCSSSAARRSPPTTAR